MTRALKWKRGKDPDEAADFSVNWAPDLGADTISASAWSIASGSGLTIAGNSFDNTTTTVRLTAGTAGTTYSLLNRVTTAGTQTLDQTVSIEIASR